MVKKQTKSKLADLVEERPKVVLPTPEEINRYVQINIAGKPFLRCGKGTTINDTGKILEEIQKEFYIKTNRRRCFRSGNTIYPSKTGRSYEVVGSGNCLLRGMENKGNWLELLFSVEQEKFQYYPLGIDYGHMNEILPHIVITNPNLIIMSIRLVGKIKHYCPTDLVQYGLLGE